MGSYYPLKEFNNKKEFLSILKKKKFKKKFFPIPIFFDISKGQKDKIKSGQKVNLYFKKDLIGFLFNFKFYEINKDSCLKDLFGTKSKKHPGVQNFLNTGKYFVDGKIKITNKKIIDEKKYPIYWKKIFKKKKIKNIAGFHTRNVPHSTHEKIHDYSLRKCKNLFIHPMTGKLKKGDFKKKVVIGSYKILTKNKKNVFLGEFSSHARYGGPREAMFHALVRKNFGCSHFIVGRDHAGVNGFYGKYDSQNECLKNQKKIGIKILPIKEPYYCSKSNKMKFAEEWSENKKNKIYLSGTKLRQFIKKRRKIPSYYVNRKIRKLLTITSLR